MKSASSSTRFRINSNLSHVEVPATLEIGNMPFEITKPIRLFKGLKAMTLKWLANFLLHIHYV